MKQFSTFLFSLFLFSGLAAQNLPSYLPSNGLVGWWPFNGNANDESGNGNHGTVNGATLTADRFGNTGKAYGFNGQDNFIDAGDNISIRPKKISISVWYYTTNTNPFRCLVSKTTFSNAVNEQFFFDLNDLGIKLNSDCNPNQGWSYFRPENTGMLSVNSWTHLVFMWDSISHKIFKNGVQINGNNWGGSAGNYGNIDECVGGHLQFGRWWQLDPKWFDGKIDDIAIYNRALTEQEITALYQAGNPTYLQYQLQQQKLGNCSSAPVKLSVLTMPRIKTDSVNVSVNGEAATAYASIVNDGGKTISRRGFCWSTSANPTLSNSFSENGSGSGSFSGSISGLSANTNYFVRAYAGTNAEVWYGNELMIGVGNTLHSCGTPSVHNAAKTYGTMTDQDGNTYKTIQIGNQVWMAENLKTGHYRNGEEIPVVTDNIAWSQSAGGTSCWNNNDSTANDCPFGRLYNWYSVTDPRGLCPAGWHSPTDDEWKTLELHLGMPSSEIDIQNGGRGESANVAGKLKSISSLWNQPNPGAENSSGFSAIPSGNRYGDVSALFSALNTGSYFWTSSPSNLNGKCYFRHMNSYDAKINRANDAAPVDGFAVRCLKDAPETGSINSLDCGGAVNTGTIYAGQAASGASTTISYTGGNGGSYSSRVIASTGVTGLTATLTAGNFASGNGSLSFTISGTPASTGTAIFALSIGGQSCSFTRLVVAIGGGVTDIDGNTYGSVIIGNQEWMSENLKVSKYRNGNIITTGLSNAAWRSTTSGAYGIYNNDPINNNIHGKLYNWYATVDSRGLCPIGWHVPTDHDWQLLTKYMDPTSDTSQCCLNLAGGKVKSTGTIEAGTGLWLSPNGGATNVVAFNADATGSRNQNGPYYAIGGTGFWWTTTSFSSTKAYFRYIYSGGPVLMRGDNSNGNLKVDGFAVRCLKD